MLCSSCGAANADTARFCNMCGAPLDPMAVTQRGLSVEAARAVAEASAATPPTLSLTSSGSTTQAAQAGSLASAAALAAGSTAAGPARSEGSAPAAWPGLPAGFDPSTSLALESLGIRTPRRLGLTAVAVAAACIGIGVLASRLLAPEPPHHGTAAPTDPFVIGAPTADVDYVSGSALPDVPALPGVDAGARPGARDRANPPGSAVPVRGPTEPPPADPAAPPGTQAPADAPAVPSAPDAPPAPGDSPSTPPGPTPDPPSTDPPAAPADDPAMALDLYAARVRYLVRRYHGAEAQRCFDDAIAREPSLSGQVLLQVPIDASGVVGTATVGRNTTGDDALGRCLAARASSWTLAPPPGGAVTLSFPFSR